MQKIHQKVKGIIGVMSRVKTRKVATSYQRRKRAMLVTPILVFILLAAHQISFAALKNTLSPISYSEMDAINKGMGLVQISAKVQDRTKRFNEGVKAYTNEEFALALRLFEPLATQGHTESQYYLGVLYDMGIDSARNSRVAYQWYRLAAIGGDDRAQHNLAVAYAKGDGVEANLAQAMKWWKLSSLQGNADSQYNLGILYAMGRGDVTKDIVKAMKWWRKAASSGDAVAQFNLGTIYANGESGTTNYCEAERWWVQSAEAGFSEANFALSILRQRNDYYSCD